MGYFSNRNAMEIEDKETKQQILKETMIDFICMFRWDVTKEQLKKMKSEDIRKLYNAIKSERNKKHSREFDSSKRYTGVRRNYYDMDDPEEELEGPTL